MTDAVTTLSLITLAQQYRMDIVRQINRMTVFLKLIRIVPGEGKNVSFVTEADGALAESYTEGADAANFGGDAQASAILTWGLYRSNFHVTQLAMDAAATTQTPAGNRGLWARNLLNATSKLAATVNAACFNGAGTSGLIAGLDVAIGDDTNTYATIARGSNAYFCPTVVDPGVSTAPTMALIRDDIRQIYEDSGENPDIALCSPAAFNKVGSLFDSTRRQVDAVMTARGPIRLDFGYQAIELDGMMFMKDKDATANQFYYVNTNHVELQYLPTASMSALPQVEVEGDDGFGNVPLGMDYELLAKLGASEKAEVRTTVQLVCSRPNSCGVRKNVNTAA
jgi:hypothetical protein